MSDRPSSPPSPPPRWANRSPSRSPRSRSAPGCASTTPQKSPKVLADQPVEASGSRSWVRHEPMGTVLAIMPWNFPYWQVFRFAAPTLMAGNAGILKHSPNVTGVALDIEKVFTDAGLPEGVFRTLVVAEPDVPATVDGLIQDDRISAVTPDRQQPSRLSRRRQCRAGRQEEPPRARRLGPVRRPRGRRPGRRGAEGRRRALPEHRPVLPVRQAVHRARVDRRGVRPPVRRRCR